MSRSTFPTDLAAWLAAHGVGVAGTSLFIGQIPESAVEAVLIVPTAGLPGDPAVGVDFPAIQVTARSPSFATAHAKAHRVFDLLNEMPATTMGTSRVTYCKAQQLPTSLGTDEAEAWRIVCNYRFWLPRT